MTLIFSSQILRDYATSMLADAGMEADDASTVAASLVHANLRGVDSHGVTRLPIYLERLRRGLVKARPTVQIVSESGGVLVIDGDNGMGAVVMSRALDLAFERLPTARSMSVAVRNSNHYGSGAYYAHEAASRGAGMFLYGNAPATVAPWGGTSRFLGTNPYTFAVPTGSREPLILDMATSVVARGKIILAAQRDEEIPPGWALDGAGAPTTDPQEALAGSVLPFGGAKGYGIALMVEVMAGVLSGAQMGPAIGDLYAELDRPQELGLFFTLLDIDAFLPLHQFTSRMDHLIDQLKSSSSAGTNEVLVPGEVEARTAERRAHSGVPLSGDVVAALDDLAAPGAPPLSHLATDAASA